MNAKGAVRKGMGQARVTGVSSEFRRKDPDLRSSRDHVREFDCVGLTEGSRLKGPGPPGLISTIC